MEWLLSIDPGETTGYCKLAHDGHTIKNIQWGTWKGIADFVNNIHIFRNTETPINTCIIEDYIIYPHKAISHTGSRVLTAREIGRIELICYVDAIPIAFQLASAAKQAWPRNRMDLYELPRLTGHAFSAFQHMLHYLERIHDWRPTHKATAKAKAI
jgi:hypothetical protein